jgi:hypothetical protein
VIGKVLRGTNARRLLYYLYGPGKANEHTDPHLVAGFSDPAELEPEHRSGGSRDFRRLAGLLAQPLAALAGPGYARSVWHCAVRAAPEDRLLSDVEWAQVAAAVMDHTGLASAGDELGVRWVAVRHAVDHIHLVATLARQDGIRPRVWNDFYQVRAACQEAEARLGLRSTGPADRTAARCPSRPETERAVRCGWSEPPRVTLRREVCTAAAGAASEQQFFAHLEAAGIAIHKRYSTATRGEVTGYAVGLPSHRTKDGQIVWFGGGKLAADLTLPKLRRRWAGPDTVPGQGLPPAAARGVLRYQVAAAARQTRDEAEFFAAMREAGALVRLRSSESCPGQVTGYAVGLPGHNARDGTPLWYGGGRLAAGLTLPRLRAGWALPRNGPERPGAFRCTIPEQNAIFDHAARQAHLAAEHIRFAARGDPAVGADVAWAAADALRVAARVLNNPELRRAAESYDRAARAQFGRIPHATGAGHQVRATARLMAMAGRATGDATLVAVALIANLADLTLAVAELRRAQRHAAQAAAARAAASHLQAARDQRRPRPERLAADQHPSPAARSANVATGDFPAPLLGRPLAVSPHGRQTRRGLPRRRAGPSP